MTGSQLVISKKNIELEIYNTFEKIEYKKKISIADFLNRLAIHSFFKINYRSIKYSYESLLNLIIFQKLKGIKFQTQLIKYLKKHPRERYQLGLQRTPNQRTINYFTTHILANHEKELIAFITKTIEEISDKFGFLPDIKLPQIPTSKNIQKDSSVLTLKKQKTYEITKLFKKRFSAVLNLNLHHNTKYTKKDFIDLLLHMCKTKDFAENGSHSLKVDRERVPQGETLLYHLKNYNNTNQIKRIFSTVFEINWQIARKMNLFNRPVDVGIDFTDIPFYGDKNVPMIVEKQPGDGTTHCYRYATINIVDRNKRFVLLAVPYGKFDNKERILHQLLSYTLQRIKIRRLYADRAFFTSTCIEIFKRYHIKFIIPATENNRVKKLLEIMDAPSIVRDYEMKNTRFHIAIAQDEKMISRAFATNIEFNERDVGFSSYLFNLYGKRWGVETTYRVLKHAFWAKTT
jgi:putative transposase